jgi:hypothetical protein
MIPEAERGGHVEVRRLRLLRVHGKVGHPAQPKVLDPGVGLVARGEIPVSIEVEDAVGKRRATRRRPVGHRAVAEGDLLARKQRLVQQREETPVRLLARENPLLAFLASERAVEWEIERQLSRRGACGGGERRIA